MNWYKEAQASIVFEIKEIQEITSKEKMSLHKLNLGKYDKLYDSFKTYVKDPEAFDYSMAKVVLAKNTIDKIVGWALINPPNQDNQSDVFIYVAKRERRQGVGRKLVEISKQYLTQNKQRPNYIIHDKVSKDFYESIPGLSWNTEYNY